MLSAVNRWPAPAARFEVIGRGMDAAEQLEAIAAVTALGVDVWLRGGWAMDFFLGRVTRPHRDVDWFAWASDAGRLVTALTSQGYELLPEPEHDRQLDFVRGGVDLSFALIARDGAGHVIVAGGPWAGQRWPDGMLDWPAGRIGDLWCPVISPSAQVEIKKMMPVWVPGMPTRPKDAADVAVLETAVHESSDGGSTGGTGPPNVPQDRDRRSRALVGPFERSARADQ